MVDAVPLPTGVLETSVGVVTAGAVFTTLYVGHRIGDWMAEYNHEERAQIVSLQNCYRDKCYFLEKSEHSLSNRYPNHFLLKLQPRGSGFFNKDIWLPEMWRERFSPMFNANKWISNLNEGELRSNIAECISYICLYQIERGDSEQHSYSPLHLFFEEFKTWLHKLSTIDITQERFKNIVTARIAYLVEVGNLGFFRNSYNYFGYGDKVIYPTPSQTLVSLEYKMKNIRDKMILAISRRSAREHFKDLKINIERLLYSSLNFLLHLFSDQAMPSTFILTELKQPTIPSFRKIQDTFLFTILSDFVKTPAFGVVFKLDYFKFETPNYSLDDDGEAIIVEDTTVVILKTFLGDQKGSVLVDDVIERMDKINKDKKELEKLQWYQSDESCVSILFSSQPASIVCFLNLLFWLQKLCYFYQISDQIHALAGEGGNLLVYGKAVCGTTTGKLIERFKIDFEITKKHFKLLQAAGQHFCTAYKNDPNNFRKYTNMKQWIANLSIAESVYTEIDKSISLITRCIAEIETKMAEVNSVAYRIKLAKQIETLTSSVNEYLCIEDPSANPTLSMIPTSQALINSNGNKNKVLVINDDEPLPAIEYYSYGDNPNKKKKERKKSGKK